jgi:spermidine/putrescine transport system permease protein
MNSPMTLRITQLLKRRFSRRHLPLLLVAPCLAWLLIFFVLPILQLLRQSWSRPITRFGLETSLTASPENYTDAISLAAPLLLRSLSIAGLATAIGLLIGFPMAWWIVRRGGRWKPLLTGLVVTPFFFSYLVRTIAWTTLLADSGPLMQVIKFLSLGHFFNALGLLQDGRLLNTTTALIAGLTYNYLPFLVLPLIASLGTIDPTLLEAAADLGARTPRIFIKVVFPLALPGLISGSLLTFIPAMGDVVNSQYLGGVNDRMIGNLIADLVLIQQRFSTAAAISMLLLLMIGLSLLIYSRKFGKTGLGGT